MINYLHHENHNIAITMSSSCADPVLPWLGVFKCLYQSHCTDWGHLNVFIRVAALAGGILRFNHDIAIAMSSSRAVPVLGLNILQG